MTFGRRLKFVGAAVAFGGLVLAAMFVSSPRGKADDRGNAAESRIEQGFEIAPVPLNLEGKNRALVGLGSYLVNAAGDCNACHNPGPGNNQFASGGNPFLVSRRRSIRRRTWAVAGISVRWCQVLLRTLSPAI